MTDGGYAAGDPITEGSLYRRIPPLPDYYVHAEQRPASLAFLPDSGEDYVSMALTSMVTAAQVLNGFPGFGLCEVDVQVLIDLGLRVTYEPEHGRGHVAVWGLNDNKPGVKLRRKIAFRARVIQPPAAP